MFEKIRLKLYNQKTKQKLQGVIFQDFGYFFDVPFPMFATINAEGKKLLFAPKTIEMLKICILNLDLTYFLQIDRDEFKNRLLVFFCYFGLDKNELADCLLTYETKKAIAQNPKITTEHLK